MLLTNYFFLSIKYIKVTQCLSFVKHNKIKTLKFEIERIPFYTTKWAYFVYLVSAYFFKTPKSRRY